MEGFSIKTDKSIEFINCTVRDNVVLAVRAKTLLDDIHGVEIKYYESDSGKKLISQRRYAWPQRKDLK